MAIRKLEDDKLPIPNGWFAVGWSHELHAYPLLRTHFDLGEGAILGRSEKERHDLGLGSL